MKEIITYEELKKITSQAWLSVNDIMLQQVNVQRIKLKMLLKKIY